MSAIYWAMAAGAAAAAARHRRLMDEIDRSFDTTQLRQDAREVYDLINESEKDSFWVGYFILGLGIFAIFGGAKLGEILGGESGTVIGSFVGPIALTAITVCIDRYLFKRPARQRLQRFVEQHPQGRHIEEKVRAILDHA